MPVKLNAIAPTFLVENVVRAAEYYRDRMGFEISPYFGDPPAFTIVRRGEARFGLRGCQGADGRSNRKVVNDAVDAYVWVEGLDELHRELMAKGAEIGLAPVTREYGLREFEVRDADGYVVCFGEFVRE